MTVVFDGMPDSTGCAVHPRAKYAAAKGRFQINSL